MSFTPTPINPTTDSAKPSPFIAFTQRVIPATFDQSLSYQEALYALLNYINQLVETINENAEVTDAQTKVIEEMTDYLNNYFDNLDVQEEINNKLDQMAEDGTLEAIITSYINLNAIIVYNTVADMSAAEGVTDGMTIKTLGYHAINDGGSGLYHVREITNQDTIDNGSIIALNDNTLVAELIASKANAKQFGAYGDNEHDDTTALSNTMLFARKKKYEVYIPAGSYIVSDTLPNMDAGSVISGDCGFVSAADGIYYTKIIDTRTTNRQWLFQYYQADTTNLVNKTGTCIKNIAFVHEDDNNEDTKWLINFQYILSRVLIENVSIKGYERCFFANDTHNFRFNNVFCNKVGSYTGDATHYYAFEFQGLFGSIFDHIQMDGVRYAVKLTTREGSSLPGQTKWSNCHFEQGATFNTTSSGETDALLYFDTGYVQEFTDCMFVPAEAGRYADNAPYTIYGSNSTTLMFTNCYFHGTTGAGSQGKFIYAQTLISNCVFTNISYTYGIRLSGSSSVSSSKFSTVVSSDITTNTFVISNGDVMPICPNNHLNITLSGVTSTTRVPSLFFFYQPYTLTCTNNKYTRSRKYQTADKWNNCFCIQQVHSDYSIAGTYHIKICEVNNQATFSWEGLVKVNSDMTMSKISTIAESGIATYPIDIYTKNNVMQIQCSRITNNVKFEVYEIENQAINFYWRTNQGVSTVDATHLYINS